MTAPAGSLLAETDAWVGRRRTSAAAGPARIKLHRRPWLGAV